VQDAEQRAPLDGVTVLDLTRLLPGAYCTLLLADMGARVVKIEDPRGGDPVRAMTPIVDGGSVYFQSLNRGKASVTLDLRSPRGREILERLLDTADVLVESFRPRTARQIGVDGRSLLVRHPRLVHCAITGFGQDGPYADRAGHDINYVALAGLLAIDTPAEPSPGGTPPSRGAPLEPGAISSGGAGFQPSEPRVPHVPRMFLADIGGGALSAVAGILAALFARERTGAGTTVDISMHEGALAWLTFPAARTLVAGGEFTPADLPIFDLEASYNVYRTADGLYLALGALEHKFWVGFCERIGRPDLGPRQFVRGAEQRALHEEVAAIVETRTRDAWLDLFRDVDVCLSTVHTVREAIDDPHVSARGVIGSDGVRRFVLSPIRVGGTRGKVRPAPALGVDTDEVLARAGISEAARASLRADRVI
jgi:alpha-methylacyl-CoA racemase